MADAVRESVEVRAPDGGRYSKSATFTVTDTVSPLAFPDVTVRLSDTFAWKAPGL